MIRFLHFLNYKIICILYYEKPNFLILSKTERKLGESMKSLTGEYKGKITNLAVIILIAFNLLHLIPPYENNFPLHFFPLPVPSSADRILIRIKISNAMSSVGAGHGSL